MEILFELLERYVEGEAARIVDVEAEGGRAWQPKLHVICDVMHQGVLLLR